MDDHELEGKITAALRWLEHGARNYEEKAAVLRRLCLWIQRTTINECMEQKGEGYVEN